MTTNFTDVGDFHEKFGLRSVNDGSYGPTAPDRELMSFRLNFLLEELSELMEATGASFYEPSETGDKLIAPHNLKITVENDGTDADYVDHPQAFDALMDLVYIALGTAHLQGYPWQIGWNAVQAANMAKERAERAEDSKRGSVWDVIKPPGWTPPNIGKVLLDHGWRPAHGACPVCGTNWSETECTTGLCKNGGI